MWIRKAPLPQDALLQRYAQRDDCYSDCYTAQVRRAVDLESYITAFYQTPLFKSERLILSALFKAPSTKADLTAMARGDSLTFAAWSVEARERDQILLTDKTGRTRSWLMMQATPKGNRLYFGSAVVPPRIGASNGAVFTALLPFHKLYARALLRAAVRALH